MSEAKRVTRDNIPHIDKQILNFVEAHAVSGRSFGHAPLSGDFALYRGATEADLYGMIDAAYILRTVGQLAPLTTRSSRFRWAEKILACQDENGWFARRNLRGHRPEHATAYALGALKLLEIEPDEEYLSRTLPLRGILPLLEDENTFEQWIERLGLRYSLRSILKKNVGWNHIWRSSHIGGGVAAAITMTRSLISEWWPKRSIDLDGWFSRYFDWLDKEANPDTGMWQKALWNKLITRPTKIDMGGAVHFFWVYEAHGRAFPYPEQTITSTINLQRDSGLFDTYPYCIDLDGVFCIIRGYEQLDEATAFNHRALVRDAVDANARAIIKALTGPPLIDIYRDLHGLPGALAALTESRRFLDSMPDAPAVTHWLHPLDLVCWI